MRRIVAMMLCSASGYVGAELLQSGRVGLAVCAWLVGVLIAAAWIVGDVRPTR